MIGDESNKTKLTEEKRRSIINRVNYFADSGYRVISLAYRAIDDLPRIDDRKKEREYIESDLTYIGFMVIYDPPRPGAREAVADLDAAGIFPIMITGDAPATAATIARQVGILDGDELVVEGRLAPDLNDSDFFKTSVFARVSPQDKEIIVSRWQARGDVVTMTGDGINDSLAITRADAGVSMGITGTDVTKEAADLIITDDSYVSLVNGVREGRNLFEKIRIMIYFYLTINLAEASLYFITSFIPGFHLITAWQRIWIFSILHLFPVLAIIFGPPDDEIMKLKPRSNDNIIPIPLLKTILLFSVTYLVTLLSVYSIYYFGVFPVSNRNLIGISKYIEFNNPNDPTTAISFAQAKARTMLITTMYFTESFIVLSIRRINKGIFKGSSDASKFVWVMILISIVLQLIMIYTPSLQELLIGELGVSIELMFLTAGDFFIVLFFALFPIFVLEMYKKSLRKNGIQL